MKGKIMTDSKQQDASQDSATQAKLQQVQSRFGAVAAAYVTSNVHANGQDLNWIVDVAALTGTERVLDVATGGGHVAFTLAPHSSEVVALDLTHEMLQVAQQEAVKRQLLNISFLAGDAQKLPCEDASFDVIVCRQAAHHFPQVRQAVQEWQRVLKPGGKLVLDDSVGPEEPAIDTFLQEIEALRDPSHMRSLRVSEWNILLQENGFTVRSEREWGIFLDVLSWTQRMRTPATAVEIIEQRLRSASPAARKLLRIEEQHSTLAFTLPAALIMATKAEKA
jgi:ubiquinone/menaquinone biosynthesis C-methylase UbiE